jgi:hypothetical protein
MGTTPNISSSGLDGLRSRFSGRILRPDDTGYEEARRVHNGLIDRRPALIVRCQTAADVATAVDFGRAEGLDITVRGGGHNVAGRAVADDALMIDLAEMKGIRVDPDAQTVAAEGGGSWREYVGGYTDWLRQRPQSRPAPARTSATPAPAAEAGRPSRRRLLQQPLQPPPHALQHTARRAKRRRVARQTSGR